jgi:hypothetical protein
MQRPKYVAFLFVVGAVLVGYALGFAADRVMVRDRLAPRWDQHAVRTQLHDDLGLSAAQRAAVDSILDARNARMATLVAPIKPQLDAVKDSARAAIRVRLDAGQQAKWDAILRELDAKK